MLIKQDLQSFEYMFSNWINLIRIDGKINVSNCTNFGCMFYNCSSLQEIDGFKNWDVSNCSNFVSMFYNCCSLQELNALKNGDVSNGKYFNEMFECCSSLQFPKEKILVKCLHVVLHYKI